jgi:hypothetical protein
MYAVCPRTDRLCTQEENSMLKYICDYGQNNPRTTSKGLKKIKMQELTPFLSSMEQDVCPLEVEET